ncbi:lactate dehydrogenase [Vibrio sp. 10N.286.49.B3]|uniref:lactate dehydrogenase n=1 Tax=Vibrio sp. 10N.286.49.B3 TaxID=1880855 RepID=UPI000C829453|nr:lactate dehydrogenase [Vibrio sp. 10N.286.49.B3]PMH43147.1 lactate dehydrogenase [Vibrio sp. 10N.286.49.B3]
MSNGKLPNVAHGLQLNFCKTLACKNFGSSDPIHYILQHTNPKRPTMICRECGAFPPLLNNQDVLDEYQRLKQDENSNLLACRNSQCHQFGLSVHTHKHLYHAFGFSGDRQRYRCKACLATFVDKCSGKNKDLAFQEQLLALLFMGYSVREICRKLAVNPKTFYDHLRYIANRCRDKLTVTDHRWLTQATSYQFASHYHALQPNSNNGVYWLMTGEAHSGYILSQHINYTSDTKEQISREHNAYKPNARYVATDFSPEATQTKTASSHKLNALIEQQYQTILARSNVEDPMGDLTSFTYPSKGALIRPPYTAYAHFLHLFNLCDQNKPIALYLPQDPLLRSAALSLSLDRIESHKIDLMYVQEESGWDQQYSSDKVDIVYMSWWRDRWAIGTQNHHQKGLCYLAGDNNNLEHWLQFASLQQTEFYQQRFQLLFSHFINEPRRKLRPAGLLPLLDIFRAWHNLCYQQKDGQTAAQKLGLTKQPMTVNQLLS